MDVLNRSAIVFMRSTSVLMVEVMYTSLLKRKPWALDLYLPIAFYKAFWRGRRGLTAAPAVNLSLAPQQTL